MVVGGLLTVLRVLLCGRCCLGAFYGIYEVKGMTEVLRIVRGH
jgi:hypothetical protein